VHYKRIGTKDIKWGDFADIESTINYSSCLEPSLCMGKRASTYAWLGKGWMVPKGTGKSH